MSIAEVHDSHLTFDGIHYFRGGAESVSIGTYGEKKTPVLNQNFLAAQSDIPAAKLVARPVTVTTIDFNKSKEADVSAGLKVASISGSVSAGVSDLKSGKLKLVKLEVRLDDILNAVNSLPDVLNDLRNDGLDARVAHQVFVVMEATIASAFQGAAHISFARNGDKLQVTASGGASAGSTTTVTLSPGTTYAYLLCKPDWHRGKDQVDKFIVDQWGIG